MTTAKPDGWVAYQWRRLKTGLVWVVFGAGALALAGLWFPLLHLTARDAASRRRLARRSISASFRFFIRLSGCLGVFDADTSALAPLARLKGAIVVANHPSLLDYVLLASAMPEVGCLVKSALARNFFLKGVIRGADYFYNDTPETVIDDITERLAQGESILIFPEGTRTRPGEPLVLKRGVAQLAVRSRLPVQVVLIHASERWLCKGDAWHAIPRRRPGFRLEAGEALEPSTFVEEGVPPSVAARRLTRHMTQLLSQGLLPQAETEP